MNFKCRLEKRKLHEEKNIPWYVHVKYKGNKVAIDNNVSLPQEYASWQDAESINLNGMPKRFVLKPSSMHSSIGVMLLEKTRFDGVYYNHFNNDVISESEIIKKQSDIKLNCKYKSEYLIMAEEYIEDQFDYSIPLDYKVYCFYDKVAFIQVINRNKVTLGKSQSAYFDSEWNKLPFAAKKEHPTLKEWLDFGHDLNLSHNTIVSDAIKLCKAINTPFVRIDFYLTKSRTVFGEFTLLPGNQTHIRDAIDEMLGVYWQYAEKKLQENS